MFPKIFRFFPFGARYPQKPFNRKTKGKKAACLLKGYESLFLQVGFSI